MTDRKRYYFVCVGGAHKPKGCGYKFVDKGATQCPECRNPYVKNLSVVGPMIEHPEKEGKDEPYTN